MLAFGIKRILSNEGCQKKICAARLPHRFSSFRITKALVRISHPPADCSGMTLPYKLATLLYCFNASDEVLLLERAQEPNLGLWSPCGGKLRTDIGESPYTCACREAQEEM